MKDYKMIPKISLWVLMGLGIICSVMFFFLGGSEGQLEVAGDFLEIPYFTNLFLTWNYILVALVCLVTLAVVVWEFVKLYKVDSKKALRSLFVVVGFVALIVICWMLASPEEVKILGYEGTDNVGGMARLSGACLLLTYILVVATVVALVWGVVHTKRLSK
ncbi:MAG: hypothetical protein MJZ75_05620 [Paludibacteraceae bacterium]|nr:hypothetical protein [Paludibacteraceae bacterium]